MGALLLPSAVPCCLLFLASRICFSLFSYYRRTVASKFFNTQVYSISTEKFMLPRHACCILSCLCCKGQSLLLNSFLSRIGRIEDPSRSACGDPTQGTFSFHSALSVYGVFTRLAFWQLFVFLRPLVQALRSCPASGAPWSSAMSHTSEGAGNNNIRIKI